MAPTSKNRRPGPHGDRREKNSSYDEAASSERKWARHYLKWVFRAVGALMILAVLRLVWIQLIDGPNLASIGETRRTNAVTLQAKRGTIYDRNGNVLATSQECRTLYANPKDITDPHGVAAILAESLGGTPEDYLSSLTQDTTFVYLKKKVDTSKADEVLKALQEKELIGVYSLPDMRRVYPYGATAGQVLGLVGEDGEGRTGLELQYNDILEGTDGQRIMETGLSGTPIAGGRYEETEPTNGTDIVVSLDVDIQEMAEEKIAQGAEQYDAESGFVTVTDPKTGEILAMCSTPLLDPNDTGQVVPEQLTLRSVTDSYEPGSVIKVLTTAIGLENGSFTTSTSFQVPPTIKVGDDTVKDDDDRKQTMAMDAREILRRSSNVGAVTMGNAIGRETFLQGMKAFGIGQKTGIDYPGEVTGITAQDEEFTQTTLGVMSFGQGLAIPTIQTVRAVGAIANHGVLTTPHFLLYKGTEKVDWPQGDRAVSQETADAVADLMRTVVTDGTAAKGAVEGYDIAGKTGTGEQASAEGGYKKSSYLASLVGFAPASDADVLVYVAFNGVSHLASDSAAPVFSAIMGESLLDMGVKPSS